MKRLSIEEIAKMFGSEHGYGYGNGFGYGFGYGAGDGGGSRSGDGYGQESPDDVISKRPSRLMLMI